LKGLFIGIDRYRAPITRLSCAKADALALSSLFQDNLEGEITALLDDKATLEAIRAALVGFQSVRPDDLVVISFSGHGTEDHRLVPIDVDPVKLAETCLSLQELAELLDAIPSKHLWVILDCCFSGGFGGARVFAPVSRRDVDEDRSLLAGLVRGQGRVVLTASGAGEPALETAEFGHGLLTYHLVEALQGRGKLSGEDPIRLLSLFDYVTTHVIATADRLGEVQTPTVYGSLEGAPALPVLKPKDLFAAAFPSRVRPSVTQEWSSLKPYGLPEPVLDAWTAAMPGLNPLQQRAINEFGVLDGRSLLVAATTAAGKTMIGRTGCCSGCGFWSEGRVFAPPQSAGERQV
jgi:helicase